uniref:Uncharacterized protein n=1 Tax=Rhizophora mucronata TaxID=61149 RepID=A0A2P2Q6X2_RHIMU
MCIILHILAGYYQKIDFQTMSRSLEISNRIMLVTEPQIGLCSTKKSSPQIQENCNTPHCTHKNCHLRPT